MTLYISGIFYSGIFELSTTFPVFFFCPPQINQLKKETVFVLFSIECIPKCWLKLERKAENPIQCIEDLFQCWAAAGPVCRIHISAISWFTAAGQAGVEHGLGGIMETSFNCTQLTITYKSSSHSASKCSLQASGLAVAHSRLWLEINKWTVCQDNSLCSCF